jgi:hypothetical protein
MQRNFDELALPGRAAVEMITTDDIAGGLTLGPSLRASTSPPGEHRHRFHSASCRSRQLILLLSVRGRLSTKTTERGAL